MAKLKLLKKKDKKITVLTAYDYPSAVSAVNSNVDMILVGDSLGMTVLGYENTINVTVEEMLHHTKAVRRGAPNTLVIADMPFGSYESSSSLAISNAIKFIKEASVDAIKLEGNRPNTIKEIIKAGIPVIGHIGLQPQSVQTIGGFKSQGKTFNTAMNLVHEAFSLQDAGVTALVLECVPSIVAEKITNLLDIPTIGIGAGPHCSGQVLVYHDLLGMISDNNNNDNKSSSSNVDIIKKKKKNKPSFCKEYSQIGNMIDIALKEYVNDVEKGVFPGENYSPFFMKTKEDEMKFEQEIDEILNAKDRNKERNG